MFSFKEVLKLPSTVVVIVIPTENSLTVLYMYGHYSDDTWALRRTLHWHHNGHDGVSNHQPHGCLLKRLFRRRSKKTSKLRVTGFCVGNSPGPVNSPHKGPVTRKTFPFDDVIMLKSTTVCSTVLCSQQRKYQRPALMALRERKLPLAGWFHSQRTNNAESVSMSKWHHGLGPPPRVPQN